MQATTAIPLLLALTVGLAAAPAQAQLTLAEVYDLARSRSPRLRAASALVEAAAAREPGAGQPADPTLQVGVMNLSLPGLRSDMPTTMVPAIQGMQMLPWPGKLGLTRRVAQQETGAAQFDAEEAWWEVRSRAAMAFYDLHEADHHLIVMRETLQLLQDLERVAKVMYGAGEGGQSDVLRAGVEVARMEADIVRMEAMRRAAAARLNGVLDRPTDTPVPFPELPPLPLDVPSGDTLRTWADETRPMLGTGRTRVEQADTRGALARKELWPDPVIGMQYGQRPGDAGTERMVSAMVGFSLPVFARSRQLKMRAEAEAMRAMARADLAEMRAGVHARLGELLAELDRTRTLVTLYRSEVLPQARANAASAFSSYRVGNVDFMTLVDAQMDVNAYEQELHSLLADYGRFLAELEMTIGRALPRTERTLAETP